MPAELSQAAEQRAGNNQTAAAAEPAVPKPPKLLYEAIELHAARTPDKPALICESTVLSYAQLCAEIRRCVHGLIGLGVREHDHLCLLTDNSPTAVIMFYAASALGLTLIPLEPSIPVEQLKAACAAAGVRHLAARRSFYLGLEEAILKAASEATSETAIFSTQEQANTPQIKALDNLDNPKTCSAITEKEQQCREFLGLEGSLLCLDAYIFGITSYLSFAKLSALRYTPKQVSTEDLYLLILTSGSTGTPKPIMLTQQHKIERARRHLELYGLNEQDVILAATPLYHSLAERLIFMPHLCGGSAVLLPRFTPERFSAAVAAHQVTFCIAVSAQLKQLIPQLKEQPEAFSSLRVLVSSSARLEPQARDELLAALKAEFHEMYGTSETSTLTDLKIDRSDDDHRCVGAPLPDVSLRILSAEGEILPPGEVGEITGRTPLLCGGYFKRGTQFEESLSAGYFRTGDLGFVDAQGLLYFTGRRKDIIIVGGINVYPADLENCLLKLPGVAQCAAFALEDERLGEIPAVAVVRAEGAAGAELGVREIMLHCARGLSDYQQPRRIFLVPSLPQSSMHKLMRSALPKWCAEHAQKS
ncbi:MAG: acyl--CoA ligase [Succinivibrio sp.]|nr:acyl--CoA ligase [Succinivibrio sp.]